MNPPPRVLPISIGHLEMAFDFLRSADPVYSDGPTASYLDLTTGEVVEPGPEEDEEEFSSNDNLLPLPADIYQELSHRVLDDFVDSLPEEDPWRTQLAQAISGRGAWRRFKDIVFGGGNVELKYRWQWFETRRQRECIVHWLRRNNIEPQWDCDIFQAPPMPNKRGDLLRAVVDFVRGARITPGVRRIALMGSLVTPKAIPKDVDLLVEVEDSMPLDGLARLSRQLSSKAMQTGDGCGGDVFLCNPRGQYIGRICSWKQCAPGIRQSCKAQHCGLRHYLSDDFHKIRLEAAAIAQPPLELWPAIVACVELPEDVRTQLVEALAAI